jgi:hypothetical protein
MEVAQSQNNIIFSYQPIKYVLCDVENLVNQGMVYHLLSHSDFAHLRSLMTLSLLPTDLSDIDPMRPVFRSAFKRSSHSPFLYRTPPVPPENQLPGLTSEPYLIVFLAAKAPPWLRRLLQEREIGILTDKDEVAEDIAKVSNAHVGLLRGNQDLIEAYRVIRKLIEYRLKATTLSTEEQNFLRRILLSNDIFATRPRLSFIPPVPLPQDLMWRPAAYLLNRI